MGWSHERDGRLARSDAGMIVADDGVLGEVGDLVPWEPGCSTLPRRAYGLRSGNHRYRQRAAGDVRSSPVDQPLGGVAADGGDLASAGGHARPAGHLGGGRWTHSGHHADDAQAVDPAPEPRGILERALAGLNHEVDRGHQFGALDRLSRGDDDGDAVGVVLGSAHGCAPEIGVVSVGVRTRRQASAPPVRN